MVGKSDGSEYTKKFSSFILSNEVVVLMSLTNCPSSSISKPLCSFNSLYKSMDSLDDVIEISSHELHS